VPLSAAERNAAYRQRLKDKGEYEAVRQKQTERNNVLKVDWPSSFKKYAYKSQCNSLKPFIGCDGEGGGVDEQGRQLYKLLRIGDMELYDNDRHLSTEDCLKFILAAPKDAVLVGFSFGYDITMILRDLPDDRRERLLSKESLNEVGLRRYTFWRGFAIQYLPKQFIRVALLEKARDANNNQIERIAAASVRTIWETFGFFQTSFLKAIGPKGLNVCDIETLERIEHNKNERSSFDVMTNEVREYCALECDLLAKLMERLREHCGAADIIPKSWSGAGKLAEALHKREHTMERHEIEALVTREVIDFADEAYYGGRFEVTRIGKIDCAVHEHDIRSAYPAAMESLPCLRHGGWKNVSRKDFPQFQASENLLYIGLIDFDHVDLGPGQMCAFPIRDKTGVLYWPRRGSGIYWSHEIRSAIELGCHVKFRKGFLYEKRCDCKPFDWVRALYDYRRSIGSAGPGYPIKLGINSLYGKLAQRLGARRYHNPIWAGLITSWTRAQINLCIAQNPGRILMAATDAVYSLDKLTLPIGEELGEWEYCELSNLFIVQPGLYWGGKKKKARGIPSKFWEDETKLGLFYDGWDAFREMDTASVKPENLTFPVVGIPVNNFVGLKLAQARGKPETAGKWVTIDKAISFDWTGKRAGYRWDGEHVITEPRPGYKGLVTMAHADFSKTDRNSELDMLRDEYIDMPDFVDLTTPWKD
jgi:hypothetical protein